MIEAPLIGYPDLFDWQDTADMVVIGFGAAGAAAALETKERATDLDVLIVDRFEGGGATALSGGVIYAGGTRHQRDAGYEDSGDEMYKYLSLEVGDAVTDDTLRCFCESSNDLLTWLEKHGVVFGSTLHEGKASYPPPGKFLYYSGNEKVAKYKALARPAPRGHRTVGKGLTGRPFFDALKVAVVNSGIRQIFHSPVKRLVLDTDGAVIGIEVLVIPEVERATHKLLFSKVSPMLPFQGKRAEKAIAACMAFEDRFCERRLIKARRGVVLAAGGFTYNLPMLKEHTPSTYFANSLGMFRLGSMGCSGDGILLGKSAGGQTAKMGNVLIARAIAPPAAPVEGVMVNRDGRRFINEDTYLGFLGDAISRQTDGVAWLLFDSTTFWKVMRDMLPNGDGSFLTFKLPALANILFGGTKRATTLEGLAKKCGVDPDGLVNEITTFNATIERGSEDFFGKVDSYRHALGKGSYYAVNMSLSNQLATTLTFTLGGLQVDEDSGLVLGLSKKSIPGLYAVGRNAVGVCSNTYFSGMSLTDCIFSGRRAGRHLVAR